VTFPDLDFTEFGDDFNMAVVAFWALLATSCGDGISSSRDH
jgi:hypothetical protein